MAISKFAFSPFSCRTSGHLLKHHLNSKLIPQSDSTTYLALIRSVQSIRIRCQTSTVEWVELNDFFLGLAPRLVTSNSPFDEKEREKPGKLLQGK